MTRKIALLLLAALCGPGCLSPGTRVEKESRQLPPVRLTEVPPPPPVTADQVTESNAADVARALAKEMDGDANNRPAANANGLNP